jgi:hypothetical protein
VCRWHDSCCRYLQLVGEGRGGVHVTAVRSQRQPLRLKVRRRGCSKRADYSQQAIVRPQRWKTVKQPTQVNTFVELTVHVHNDPEPHPYSKQVVSQVLRHRLFGSLYNGRAKMIPTAIGK